MIGNEAAKGEALTTSPRQPTGGHGSARTWSGTG